MKINFIVPEITRTGGMNIIFQYANRLLERGHDVELYSPIIPFNLHKNRFRWYYFKYQIRSLLNWLRKGRKIIPSNMYPYKFKINFVPIMLNAFVRDADVSVATSWPTSYPVYHFNLSKGRKYYFIQGFEVWNANVKLVENSYKLPMNRIVSSQYLQNLLNDKFGSQSKLIYFGIDHNRFYNNNKQYNKTPIIIFQDQYLPIKNVEGAIYTCEKLKKEFPELVFRSFGIKKYHKMPEYIEFTENPDDIELTKLYSESDIFLFSSKNEGFGLPPAEAMACKCAIVANKVAAIPEYSEHMKTAIHADPEDIDGLYKGTKFLLDNPGKLKEISEAAYIHIREFMNWDNSIIHFEKFISR